MARPFLAFLPLIAVAGCAHAPSGTVDARWKADADAFMAVLREQHPKPDHHSSWPTLEAAAARVSEGKANEGERIARMAELAASVGDGHTILPILTLPFDGVPQGPAVKLLPIRLETFDDGMFVVGAARAHADLIGQRVDSIGGFPAAEAERRAMRLLPHATPGFAREYAAEWLLADLVLRHAGLMDGERVNLVIGGRPVNLNPAPAEARFDWLTSRTGGMTADWVAAPDPVGGEDRDTAVEPGLLVARIVQLRSPDDAPLGEFVDRLKTQLDAMPDAKLAIDIRDCIGGDGTLVPELVDWLASDPRFKAKGKLFLLIGRRTHSAGIMLASAVEQRTSAILVGQPTGDAPNHYGETNILVLPNSKVPVIHASRYWQTGAPNDPRRAIDPDIRTPFTHADFARDHDAAMDTVRRWK